MSSWKAIEGQRQWITVAACNSAVGAGVLLLVISGAKYANIAFILPDMPHEWWFSTGNSGWMFNSHAFKWFIIGFEPSTRPTGWSITAPPRHYGWPWRSHDCTCNGVPDADRDQRVNIRIWQYNELVSCPCTGASMSDRGTRVYAEYCARHPYICLHLLVFLLWKNARIHRSKPNNTNLAEEVW